jgi:acetyltransferase-like isoleucine patch superfamily enzyme
VFFKKHATAELLIKGHFVLGSPILGDLSPRREETAFILEDGARMEVDHVTIGRGTRIKVQAGGQVKIGANTYISNSGVVAITKGLTIGRDCAISWEVHFLDDDGHQIGDGETTKPIVVGDHVWIGARATILKGSEIGSGCVVAAGAVVSGKFPPNSLIGGVPARVLRENISWK